MTNLDHVLSDPKINRLIIDTNLLLLYLIGSFDLSLVEKTPRLNKYSDTDVGKIIALVQHFNNKILVTPNILTEITNLSGKLYLVSNGVLFFDYLIHVIKKFDEEIKYSRDIIDKNPKAFIKLGLTDASVIDAANKKALVLTDDFALFNTLLNYGFPAINYTHIQFWPN